MADVLDIALFLERSRQLPVLDVRTPAEFTQGHIPGAHNLPLFSDEERAEVGTLYKQEGRDEAVRRRLDIIGPKIRRLVETTESMVVGREVLIHCWRGGMRSAGMARLLESAGYHVGTLRGGYKSFRRCVLEAFALPREVHILGGMTGSGKTEVLRALAQRGEQVIDLEALAHHKGSVFGHLGEPKQPSQEHFENVLAVQWRFLNLARPVWIEDESRRIGRLLVPGAFWVQMQQAPVYVLDVPFEARVHHLVATYGAHEAAYLVEAIDAISKRLGGLRTKQARNAVFDGDLEGACRLVLTYYDQTYQYGLEKRNRANQHLFSASTCDTPDTLAEALLEVALCS
ncbi:MAG: tRNA 2-selenouridine(34) synthase MnmH [Rhodothermales bacterium]